MNFVPNFLAVGLIAAIIVVGCTGQDSMTASGEMKTRCIGGVTYYVFHEYFGYGYMSPKYNRDGTVQLCGQP